MACGLEVRAPFLDAECVDFIEPLAPRASTVAAAVKLLLKKAASGRLPSSILGRPKKVSASRLLAERAVTRALLDRLLAPDRLATGFVSTPGVSTCLRTPRSGSATTTSPCGRSDVSTLARGVAGTSDESGSSPPLFCLLLPSVFSLHTSPHANSHRLGHSAGAGTRAWRSTAHDVCVCLGDLVDYGPEPSRCVRWAMDHAHYAIRGNHDHGVARRDSGDGRKGYRYRPGHPALRCGTRLGAEERRYLLQLPSDSTRNSWRAEGFFARPRHAS